MPAMSRTSVIPPAWQRSGWRMVAAFFSSTSRKPHLVNTRSPVAIGKCVPCRASQQLVDGHSQRFAFDVPQGLVDTAEGAGQDRPAPVKGMTVDGLPMVHHLPWVFANQVRLDLLDRLGTG